MQWVHVTRTPWPYLDPQPVMNWSGLSNVSKCQKMSSCQKDVKCQKTKHLDYGGGSQKKLTQWGSQILTSILTSHMIVTKNTQNVHRKYFWPTLMTFICDIKININICHYLSSVMMSLCQFIFLWTSWWTDEKQFNKWSCHSQNLTMRLTTLAEMEQVSNHAPDSSNLESKTGHWSCFMLTPMRSADVTPEANLWITQARKHARDPPWLWNPGQISPDVQNRGIWGPRKRTYVLQKIKKNVEISPV